ncbi:hypothetical protein [Streptomyces sp. NPDC019890]|uniref:hypothetical protein n=1 Tax=Streptomyces sp. NPDC019890 TaxID=3365064 RepID=UPI00384D6F52
MHGWLRCNRTTYAPPRTDSLGQQGAEHQRQWSPTSPVCAGQRLGGTYFAQRDPERATRRAITALNQLGYTVTLNPMENAA